MVKYIGWVDNSTLLKIDEFSSKRSSAIGKFEDLSKQVWKHLITLLAFRDVRSINHHFSNINTWLEDMKEEISSDNAWNPDIEELVNTMYTKSRREKTARQIKVFAKDKYSSLPRLYNDNKVIELLDYIYPLIARDLLGDDVMYIKDIFEELNIRLMENS